MSKCNEEKNDNTTVNDNPNDGAGCTFVEEENNVDEVEAFIATSVTAENEEKSSIEPQISTEEKSSLSAPTSK